MDVIQKRTGDFADRKFFDDIKNMMGGYYRYENNDVFFISQKKGDGGFKIPLHLASSSVRELSDFYFYLKHSAQKVMNCLLLMSQKVIWIQRIK
ncbi:MAG: hypothetical protein ACNYPH_06015 [Gammaproteobacteria bacterium WSBS_2016_MAG_OTU1]